MPCIFYNNFHTRLFKIKLFVRKTFASLILPYTRQCTEIYTPVKNIKVMISVRITTFPLLIHRQFHLISHWTVLYKHIISAFAKLQKATVTFIMFCLSAYKNSAPARQISIKFDMWGFFFSQFCRENSTLTKDLTRIPSTLHEDLFTFFIYRFSSGTFIRKSCRLLDNVEKIWYSPTGHRWQYNTAHALCMLANWGYRHPLRLRNTNCFSTATIVTRTRLSVHSPLFWLLPAAAAVTV
jgi:hypothetical protein